MKTLYLDIFSGISGDMFIGAMLDLGVPFDQLERALDGLHLHEFHAHATRKQKSSIEGVKFDVHAHEHEGHHDHDHEEGGEHNHEHEHIHGAHDHHHAHSDHDHNEHRHAHDHNDAHHHEHGHEHEHGRSFRQIRELILQSHLSPWVKERAVAVFARIARAEGKIHGKPADEVHFHEVGAIDSIVDIVGACVCLEVLGRPRVLAAHVVDGTGWIDCAHGRFPIPAPATISILAERGIALTQTDEPRELVTPTGAALLAEFVEEFGPLRAFIPDRIGYGLGERDNKTRPNVLRALLGTSGASASMHDWETDTVAVVETNLDDVSAEVLGFVVEKALAEGALDVFHTPVQMKKNRPGVLLTVLCALEDQDRFSELLLRQTTAFGVRRSTAERRKLKREFVTVQTRFGPIQVKLGKLNGQVVHSSPEYESCKAAAERSHATLQEVYRAAERALANP